MRLSELQRQLRTAITAAGTPPVLTGNRRGLEVYRVAYRARLVEALRTNYPVLHQVLGDAAFATLADDYLQAHPSTRPSIRWFGDRLPEFLGARRETLAHPALVDMARFEWAICLAFDAAAAPPLAFDRLAATPPEDWPALSFQLQPGFALLALEWSVAPVWRALAEADDPNQSVDPPEALENTLIVWRRALAPQWRSITPLEAELLRAIDEGDTFGQLCARAVAAVGEAEAAATVVGHLQRWVADEVLVDDTW